MYCKNQALRCPSNHTKMSLQLQFYFYVINGLKITTLLSNETCSHVNISDKNTMFMVIKY